MMQYNQSSNRLLAACSLFHPCECIADIGSDHGMLPLMLVKSGLAKRVIVSDISEKALQRAVNLFTAEKAVAAARFYVSDGLSHLDEPVNAISITGLGGDTIIKIIKRGMSKCLDSPLVLSPHTSLQAVRLEITNMGYQIVTEKLVHENRRFYVLMRFEKGDAHYSEAELLLGPCLMKERNSLFDSYLAWRKQVLFRAGAEQIWADKALKEAYNTILEVEKCL